MAEKNEKNYGRSLQFSVDIGTLIRQGMNDPTVRAEIIAAVKAGPAEKLTDKLGSCNIGTQENQVWASLFAATDKDHKPGQAGLFRRAQKSGFIMLRLREQQKNMDATTGATPTTGVPTDLQNLINAAVSNAVAGYRAQKAEMTQAVDEDTQKDIVPAPEAPANDVFDADVQEILDQHGDFQF